MKEHVNGVKSVKYYLTGRRGEGKFCLIDKADCLIIKDHIWLLNSQNYVYSNKGVLMHRLIMSPPKGMVVDHINRNRLDNRRSNLRVCTSSQNAKNKTITGKTIGVYQLESGFYRIRVRKAGSTITTGMYLTEREAIDEYNRIVPLQNGEFAATLEAVS